MKYVMMSLAVLVMVVAVGAGASFSGKAPPGVVAVNDTEGRSVEGGQCPTWQCIYCSCGVGMCPGSMTQQACDMVWLWTRCGNTPGKDPGAGSMYCHVCTVNACALYNPCAQNLAPCYP
jgi:hypothetical protein